MLRVLGLALAELDEVLRVPHGLLHFSILRRLVLNVLSLEEDGVVSRTAAVPS